MISRYVSLASVYQMNPGEWRMKIISSCDAIASESFRKETGMDQQQRDRERRYGRDIL